MDAADEAHTYLAQGTTALWQGQAQEAATAFAQATLAAPDLAAGYLGQAEADFALGSYPSAQSACWRVHELAPEGPEDTLASTLLFAIDQQYDRALEAVDQSIAADPGQPYAHALRAFCLRQLGRDYDAALAEAKAARQGGNTDFRALFPQVTPAAQPAAVEAPPVEQIQPAWQPPSAIQRRVIRYRFATRNVALATMSIIAVNLVMFILDSVFLDLYIQSLGLGFLILQGEFWRLGTALFFNFGFIDLLLNMLWLYIIGRWVERLYGPWRFWLIYLSTGLLGGLLTLLVAQNFAFVGASTAVLGVFGALGAFLWHKGPGAGITLGNWLFWLILNLLLAFGFARYWLPTEIGGLAAGLLLGLFLLPDFWAPVRLRLKRGQRAEALNYALRPILVTVAIDVLLLVFAFLVIHGTFG